MLKNSGGGGVWTLDEAMPRNYIIVVNKFINVIRLLSAG